ncbi:MAG: hypothetical protein WBW16_01020 [Bacteroidota bacterium]
MIKSKVAVLKIFQRLFFRTSLVYAFVFGSFFSHDFLWWPTKGKRIQGKVRKNTKWGKFFHEYEG